MYKTLQIMGVNYQPQLVNEYHIRVVSIQTTSSNHRGNVEVLRHCVHILAGHNGFVQCLCSVGDVLFTGSQDCNIMIWDLNNLQDLQFGAWGWWRGCDASFDGLKMVDIGQLFFGGGGCFALPELYFNGMFFFVLYRTPGKPEETDLYSWCSKCGSFLRSFLEGIDLFSVMNSKVNVRDYRGSKAWKTFTLPSLIFV